MIKTVAFPLHVKSNTDSYTDIIIRLQNSAIGYFLKENLTKRNTQTLQMTQTYFYLVHPFVSDSLARKLQPYHRHRSIRINVKDTHAAARAHRRRQRGVHVAPGGMQARNGTTNGTTGTATSGIGIGDTRRLRSPTFAFNLLRFLFDFVLVATEAPPRYATTVALALAIVGRVLRRWRRVGAESEEIHVDTLVGGHVFERWLWAMFRGWCRPHRRELLGALTRRPSLRFHALRRRLFR